MREKGLRPTGCNSAIRLLQLIRSRRLRPQPFKIVRVPRERGWGNVVKVLAFTNELLEFG